MFPGWQLLSTFFLMAREHTYTTHIHHVMTDERSTHLRAAISATRTGRIEYRPKYGPSW